MTDRTPWLANGRNSALQKIEVWSIALKLIVGSRKDHEEYAE